jgi:hypothetical protein
MRPVDEVGQSVRRPSRRPSMPLRRRRRPDIRAKPVIWRDLFRTARQWRHLVATSAAGEAILPLPVPNASFWTFQHRHAAPIWLSATHPSPPMALGGW